MQCQLLNVATVHEAEIYNMPKSRQPMRTGQEKERERKQRAKLRAMLDKREKERHMREARSKIIMQRPDCEYNGVNSGRSSSSRPSSELGARSSTPSQRSSSSTVGQKRRYDDREDKPSKRISTGP
ncbi:hypothetical protein BS50DRAFT_109236 [Corynespora cassiicola Philippines]|uniref:Uncharacterized protein n=1 Tax=Corynespora cassiicola Philippines TaxID=1448308 RepID=A0A2T2NCX2_CORCC|nr:hypothetical protein BS50DRAFT_109236 [Corynespora cassiicola Philippines]